jgi:hypothetical protein
MFLLVLSNSAFLLISEILILLLLFGSKGFNCGLLFDLLRNDKGGACLLTILLISYCLEFGLRLDDIVEAEPAPWLVERGAVNGLNLKVLLLHWNL